MEPSNEPKTIREIIAASSESTLPFSPATRYGDLLFVSGIIGRNPITSTIATNDVQSQTEQALENITLIGGQAGFSLQNALKITVYLLDMAHYAEMNEAYHKRFPTDPPARTCVAVVSLPDQEALVEIDAILAR